MADSKFHGIYPMIYAFFGPDGRLDRQAMKRQIEACVASGVHGVAILGIVTEFNKLDVNERRQVHRVDGRGHAGRLPLAVTADDECPRPGRDREARRRGKADWVILQPPPVRNVPEAELVSSSARWRRPRSLPVAIQNNPVNLDVVLSAGALKTLNRNHPMSMPAQGRGADRLCAAADGRYRRRFTVFNGRGGMELPSSMRLGCAGLIPAPEVSDVLAGIYNLFRAGDEPSIAEAERLHAACCRCSPYVMASPEHMLSLRQAPPGAADRGRRSRIRPPLHPAPSGSAPASSTSRLHCHRC